MKKGFLGRKNQSLFDTTVQMKDVGIDHVVLDSDKLKSALPESGTAQVRSRPTVNYFNSHTNSDAVQGFAVPTPKVPVLPPLNGPQTNGTGSTLQLHNGGFIAVVEDEGGEILIPPPPMAAPPPPPPQFIPPSPKFVRPPSLFGDFEVPPELASLQPPPMHAPKPPTVTQSQDIDFASLKPPSMPPPKPPSDTSSTNSAKASLPINTSLNDPSDIPECPQFTPPPPPVVKQQPQKTPKAPPPKPVRMSSIPNLDVQSALTSTPAPVPSSFNPQNTAKVYSIPKTTFLSGGQDRDMRPKSILLLEDSSGDSVRVHVNGSGSTTPSPAQTPLPPAKPARRASTNTQLEKDVKDLRDNLTATLPGQDNAVSSITPKTQTIPNVIPTPPKPSVTPPKVSPKLQKVQAAPAPQEKSRQYSPLLTKKLNNIKASESSETKESATSPLALLMAAKERERQRSNLSRENSNKSSQSLELPTQAIIQPSESKPNSFTVIPKSSSSSSPNVQERLPVEKLNLPAQAAVPVQPQAPVQVTQPQMKTAAAKQEPKSPAAPSTASSNSISNVQKKILENPAPAPAKIQDQEDGDDFCIPFIPPPPEFANSDPEDGEGPPSTPPPDPRTKVAIPTAPAPAVVPPPPPTKAPSVVPPPPPAAKAPAVVPPPAKRPSVVPPPPPAAKAPSVVPPPPPAAKAPSVVPPPPPTAKAPSVVPPPPPAAKAPSVVPPPPPAAPPINPTPMTKGPPTAQKPKPPTTPKLVPSQSELKAKLAQQTKPKLPENLPSTPTSASQATLLSILQKKMLEMDPKLSVPVKEADNGTDDWGTAQSDEEEGIPVPPKSTPKAKSATSPLQSRGLDMQELETRVAQKAAGNVAVPSKSPASNGSSKQSYGMTFMVRPGTKQPITIVNKGDS